MIGRVARSLAVVLTAVLSVLALLVSWPMSTAVVMTATTALIMGGTTMPNPGAGYRNAMTTKYVDPFFGTAIPPADQVTVVTPEEFAPFVGTRTFDQSVAQGVLDLAQAIGEHPGDTLYIVGYSQSTRIQSITKRTIILAAQMNGGEFADYPDINFAMVANLNKPNGGMLQRLSPFGTAPFIQMTADGSTPTDSPEDPNNPGDFALDTKDFSFVHDGFSDFPVYPLNLLALANAIAGIEVLHATYPSQDDISPDNPNVFFQGSYGDTEYYMIRTEFVPLLDPLQSIGIPQPILKLLDEPLRVLIEAGYERETSPGQPTPIGLIPLRNPITLALNFAQSLLVGFDNAADELGLGRPLGTQKSGPFGVGGPAVPIPDPTASTPAAAAVQAAPEPDADVVELPVRRPSDSRPSATEDLSDSSEQSEQEAAPTARRAPHRPVVRGPIGADAPSAEVREPADDEPAGEDDGRAKTVVNAPAGDQSATSTDATAGGDTGSPKEGQSDKAA